MEFEELSRRVIGCALEVHRELGPGLLESAYHRALEYELELVLIDFVSEVDLPVNYKGMAIPANYRIDLFINGQIIVELKAVEKILPIHEAQLLTYMKLTKTRTGLLLNFNQPTLYIKRMVL
jgi:GxxExxY protein